MSHPYDAELIAKREAELKRELQDRIDAKIAEAKEAVDGTRPAKEADKVHP